MSITVLTLTLTLTLLTLTLTLNKYAECTRLFFRDLAALYYKSKMAADAS